MESITVELLTEPTNNAVIRLLNRRYPGVLIQGDSLYALFVDASELAAAAGRAGDKELLRNARALQENLADLLSGYEKALAQHAISLPYERRDPVEG